MISPSVLACRNPGHCQPAPPAEHRRNVKRRTARSRQVLNAARAADRSGQPEPLVPPATSARRTSSVSTGSVRCQAASGRDARTRSDANIRCRAWSTAVRNRPRRANHALPSHATTAMASFAAMSFANSGSSPARVNLATMRTSAFAAERVSAWPPAARPKARAWPPRQWANRAITRWDPSACPGLNASEGSARLPILGCASSVTNHQ